MKTGQIYWDDRDPHDKGWCWRFGSRNGDLNGVSDYPITRSQHAALCVEASADSGWEGPWGIDDAALVKRGPPRKVNNGKEYRVTLDGIEMDVICLTRGETPQDVIRWAMSLARDRCF